MLELKNINKTYSPKNGVPVQALKDVSLSFDDKGMVFVLGKSGCGKSTLLNLIGGLDFADIGEIIIDGKSTKDFKQSDYDSYRNTYIGFVFQEYNILNEFTVGENISLALELQSQKGEKQKVEDILKQVDMEGYADRKPNELSGGQRQRVAIARAIVKDPKIIMADEPTGALDSETGKAILDTLKRLSQDRLVIVVSHDREFAQQYGDRIIELADGKVIGDEKNNVASEDTAQDVAHAANREGATESQLKKSRLPYSRALTMGAKTLRRK
ncbi:MAG: ABC transporter ATP-binding protein, partial [Clostridia bacterium]|nr:ABC transporter ATP-binding protein [Clostridia bacterium]